MADHAQPIVHSPKKRRWRSRLAKAFRSDSGYEAKSRLTKEASITSSHLSSPPSTATIETADDIRRTTTGKFTKAASRRPQAPSSAPTLSSQTGERKDHTLMLHSLTHTGSFESLEEHEAVANGLPDHAVNVKALESLPSKVWDGIIAYLSLCDRASLALSNRYMLNLVGQESFHALKEQEHQAERLSFLKLLDGSLPAQLYCTQCTIYHARLTPGMESLQLQAPRRAITTCPRQLSMPKLRLTPTTFLPLSLVQLTVRAAIFSPAHGITPTALSRRWRCPSSEWRHAATFMVHHVKSAVDEVKEHSKPVPKSFSKSTHLLLRVTSLAPCAANLPPSSLRHLFYSRDDYTPYFSVCAHWQDGELMNVVKCVASHIPQSVNAKSPLRSSIPMRVKSMSSSGGAGFVTLCGFCRPLRRCPDCPTEYLVEAKMVETSSLRRGYQGATMCGAEESEAGQDNTRQANGFVYVISVTRWSDLGECSSHGDLDGTSREWRACTGSSRRHNITADRTSQERKYSDSDSRDEGPSPEVPSATEDPAREAYDSFSTIGKRAISGIFESQNGVTIPGHGIISLNPRGRRLGEEGDDWY